MANKIFKNEKSIFGKLENLFWTLYKKESFRFLIAGGLNTLMGMVSAILLRLVFDACGWNSKISFDFLTSLGLVDPNMDIPYLIVFVCLLPVAYTLQAKISFQTKWEWRRLAVYPLSSIPNFICQELFIWLFEVVLHVNSSLSYILSPICSLPIMFFIIRFLVKPFKKKANLSKVTTIFCDIDGTLIDSNSKLNKDTVSAVKRIKDKYPFYLISGRHFACMCEIYDTLELNTPIICCNGALIATRNKEIINIQAMPTYIAKEIFNQYKDQNLSLSIFAGFEWYVNNRDELTLIEEGLVNFKSTIIKDDSLIDNVIKVMLISSKENIDKLYPILKNKYKEVLVMRSKPTFIEISAKKVTKGNAIKFLKKQYNLKSKNLIAFGDGIMDESMYKECSNNVAMGNAREETKKKANIIAKTNDELGVKVILDQLK